MSRSVASKYNDTQEEYIGKVTDGYKVTYGEVVPNPNGVPTAGDSLRYTNEGANPRWTNLGLVLGQLTWSTGVFGTYDVPLGVANAVLPLAPTNGGGGCVLNPSSFLVSQSANGIMKMDDSFDWTFYAAIQLSAICTGATNLNLILQKNGVNTNILLYKPSAAGAASDWSTFGLVDLTKDDVLQVSIQDTNSSGFTLQVVSFNFLIYAIRLLT